MSEENPVFHSAPVQSTETVPSKL